MAVKETTKKKSSVRKQISNKVSADQTLLADVPMLECHELEQRMPAEGFVARVGRPRAWKDQDEFIKAVNAWIRKRKIRISWKYEKGFGMIKLPDPLPLTIASLCCHLRISPRTFQRYCKDEEHPLWGICQNVRTAIEADLWDSKLPTARLNLQSNFGHRIKSDITTDRQEHSKAESVIDPGKLSKNELKQLRELLLKARK